MAHCRLLSGDRQIHPHHLLAKKLPELGYGKSASDRAVAIKLRIKVLVIDSGHLVQQIPAYMRMPGVRAGDSCRCLDVYPILVLGAKYYSLYDRIWYARQWHSRFTYATIVTPPQGFFVQCCPPSCGVHDHSPWDRLLFALSDHDPGYGVVCIPFHAATSANVPVGQLWHPKLRSLIHARFVSEETRRDQHTWRRERHMMLP
jgi:hypothetical protein